MLPRGTEKGLTMTEYIDRKALLDYIRHTYCADCNDHYGVKCGSCEMDDAIYAIETFAASGNVPILHGRWEKDRDTIKCSVCGFGMFPIKYAFRNGQCVRDSDARYCPNCGAKMEVATQ